MASCFKYFPVQFKFLEIFEENFPSSVEIDGDVV